MVMKFVLVLLSAVSATCVNAEAMTFRQAASGGSCNSCVWTAAEGEITSETPEAFRSYLAQEQFPGRIVFDSPGGNVGAAIRLGRLIREARLQTSVGQTRLFEGSTFESEILKGRCESACVLAYVGGLVRMIDEGSLGVHQFFDPAGGAIPSEATQLLMGQILLYLLDMRINTQILSIASGTPPSGMHHLTAEELSDLRLLDSRALQGPDLHVRDGGLVAEWIALNGDTSPFRTVTLRCSQSAQAWRMTVHDHDPLIDTLPFDPDDPSTMALYTGGNALDGEPHPMTARHILHAREDADGLFLDVALPVDLRPDAGRPFAFQAVGANNFTPILAVETSVPDADTLDVLIRACGD